MIICGFMLKVRYSDTRWGRYKGTTIQQRPRIGRLQSLPQSNSDADAGKCAGADDGKSSEYQEFS
jgi:hypothetical protein